MKIINSYLITMVRNFGTIIEKDLAEVIELENGEVFEVAMHNGKRTFRELNRKNFQEALITHEYKIN